MKRLIGAVIGGAIVSLVILLAAAAIDQDPLHREVRGIERDQFVLRYESHVSSFYCASPHAQNCTLENADLVEIYLEEVRTIYLVKFSPSGRVVSIYGKREVIRIPGLP